MQMYHLSHCILILMFCGLTNIRSVKLGRNNRDSLLCNIWKPNTNKKAETGWVARQRYSRLHGSHLNQLILSVPADWAIPQAAILFSFPQECKAGIVIIHLKTEPICANDTFSCLKERIKSPNLISELPTRVEFEIHFLYFQILFSLYFTLINCPNERSWP